MRSDPSGRDFHPHRGDIYIADLGPYTGSEQGGVRPVVILQNDKGNHDSPTLIVAPVTSSERKSKTLPVHYFVRRAKGLNRKSVVLLEQVTTIDK